MRQSQEAGAWRPVARIIGVVLMVAAPMLSLAVWRAAHESRQLFDAVSRHRAPGDSATYASIAYHAAHAEATLANSWTPTGFATLGLAGVLIGLALLTSSYFRRTS